MLFRSTSRDVFNYIHANPYTFTSTEVIKHLKTLGFKSTSVSSLITQMKRNGMVIASAMGRLSTTILEYKPIVNPYTSKKAYKAAKEKKANAKAEPASAGIAALTPAKEVKTTWDAETALANLSVKDAHALWVELNKMFGGK